MTEQTEPEGPHLIPTRYRRPEQERDRRAIGSQRYFESDDPVLITHRERVTFDLPSPDGKTVEATYGSDDGQNQYGGRDAITVRFRSEDHWGGAERVADEMAKAEVEHQRKRARDKARKEMADNPMPCYVARGREAGGRPGGSTSRVRFERAHVRGIDLRSGKALVTMGDGEKHSVAPGALLNDLDRDDLRDLVNLSERMVEAGVAAKDISPPRAADALKAAGVQVDLTVLFDVERLTPYAVHNGKRYDGTVDRDIVGQAMRDLVLAHTPYRYSCSGINLNAPIVAIADRGDLETYDDLYREPAEREREVALIAAATEAKARLAMAIADHVFDLSLFTGATGAVDTAEVEHGADMAESIRAARAPADAPEWED